MNGAPPAMMEKSLGLPFIYDCVTVIENPSVFVSVCVLSLNCVSGTLPKLICAIDIDAGNNRRKILIDALNNRVVWDFIEEKCFRDYSVLTLIF